jgi:hypothetical protein
VRDGEAQHEPQEDEHDFLDRLALAGVDGDDGTSESTFAAILTWPSGRLC